MIFIKNLISDELIIEVCNSSESISQAAKKIGISFKAMRKHADRLNCLDDLLLKSKQVHKQTKYTLDEILIKNSPHINVSGLKLRLFKENIKEPKCEKCQLTNWLGEPILFHLHHIDGDENNNELSNLQILCPNCHSQTENFGSKKHVVRKINTIEDINPIIFKERIYYEKTVTYCKLCGLETKNTIFCDEKCKFQYQRNCSLRPDIETLMSDLKILKSYRQIGFKYNVSDVTVKKWCVIYNINNKDL